MCSILTVVIFYIPSPILLSFHKCSFVQLTIYIYNNVLFMFPNINESWLFCTPSWCKANKTVVLSSSSLLLLSLLPSSFFFNQFDIGTVVIIIIVLLQMLMKGLNLLLRMLLHR